MVTPVADIDVTIAVDRDIRRMVELVSPRLPCLLALAGNIGTEDRHRVRSFWLLALAEASDAHQAFALGRQLLNAMVVPVRDKDVAVLVEGDAPRLIEFSRSLAGMAAFTYELALGAEHLKAIVTAVDDDQVSALF